MKHSNALHNLKVMGMLMAFLFLSSCETSFLSQDPVPVKSASSSAGIIITPPILRLYGFQGFSYERLPDNSIGPVIAGVKITFTQHGGSTVRTVTTDANGFYRATLPAGSYYVTATLQGYEIYDSTPGFFVVTGTDGYETGNFFLRKLTYGFQGFTSVRNPDGSIGANLPAVTLTFTKNDGLYTTTVVSDASGYYKVNLPAGGYFSTAQKSGYGTYSSAPGIAIVDGLTYATYNFFLLH